MWFFTSWPKILDIFLFKILNLVQLSRHAVSTAQLYIYWYNGPVFKCTTDFHNNEVCFTQLLNTIPKMTRHDSALFTHQKVNLNLPFHLNSSQKFEVWMWYLWPTQRSIEYIIKKKKCKMLLLAQGSDDIAQKALYSKKLLKS